MPNNPKFPQQAREVQEIAKLSGLTDEEMATRANISPAYMVRLRRGNSEASTLVMESIRRILEPTIGVSKRMKLDDAPPRLRYIPVVSWAQAGAAVDYDDLPSEWMDRIDTDTSDPNAFAVTIMGDSMEPRYREGQVAILLPNVRPSNGDLVVARLKKGPVYFKRIHMNGGIVLTSYNSTYPPMNLVEKDFHWIYVVDEIREKVRRR